MPFKTIFRYIGTYNLEKVKVSFKYLACFAALPPLFFFFFLRKLLISFSILWFQIKDGWKWHTVSFIIQPKCGAVSVSGKRRFRVLKWNGEEARKRVKSGRLPGLKRKKIKCEVFESCNCNKGVEVLSEKVGTRTCGWEQKPFLPLRFCKHPLFLFFYFFIFLKKWF